MAGDPADNPEADDAVVFSQRVITTSYVERRLMIETRDFRGTLEEVSEAWSMKRYRIVFGLVPSTLGRLE